MQKPAALTKVRIFDSVAETNSYTPGKALETIEIILTLVSVHTPSF